MEDAASLVDQFLSTLNIVDIKQKWEVYKSNNMPVKLSSKKVKLEEDKEIRPKFIDIGKYIPSSVGHPADNKVCRKHSADEMD